MIEYTTLKVHPEDYGAITIIMSSFGWEVTNAMETYNVNTRISYADFYNGVIATRTTVDDFISIFWERDMNMPNYAKLCELEQEYLKREKDLGKEPSKPIKFTIPITILMGLPAILSTIFGAVYFFLGILGYIMEKDVSLFIMVAGGAILLGVGAVLAGLCVLFNILRWKSYKKNKKRYEELIEEVADILTEADDIRIG